MIQRPPKSTPLPYTTLFRSERGPVEQIFHAPQDAYTHRLIDSVVRLEKKAELRLARPAIPAGTAPLLDVRNLSLRSEEHTSELQSRQYIVCRLLLEKNYIFA